jgi:hypothetical protein
MLQGINRGTPRDMPFMVATRLQPPISDVFCRSREEGAVMKIVKNGFLCCVLLIPTLVVAQASTKSVDIGPLKSQVAAQQKLLDGVIV